MDDGLRWRAWAASIAVHVAAGLLLAGAIESRHRRQYAVVARPALRLVWVELAPAGGTDEERLGDPAAEGAPHAEPAADAMTAPLVAADPPVTMALPAAPLRRPEAPGSIARPGEPRSTRRAASTARSPRRSRRDAGPHGEAVPRASHAAPANPESAASAETGERSGGAAPASARAGERGASAVSARGGYGAAEASFGGGLGDAEAPVPIGAVARPPELLTRVMPEYPTRARHLEIEGQVVLEIIVDREGRPEPEVRTVRSIALLDAAAAAAVRQWRFRPARDAGGRPVRVVLQVPLRFELR